MIPARHPSVPIQAEATEENRRNTASADSDQSYTVFFRRLADSTAAHSSRYTTRLTPTLLIIRATAAKRVRTIARRAVGDVEGNECQLR